MEIAGVLLDDIRMAVAATCGNCACPAIGMAAANGIMAGAATESGVSGVIEFIRIDIPFSANFCLIAVACHACRIFVFAVAE